MTALARPKPAVLDPSAFGPRRDDRAPLLFAAGAAALLHFLAILIPLPDKPVPALSPPPVEPPHHFRTILRPPDPPEQLEPQPPVEQAEPEPPRIPIPFPDPPEQLPLIEFEPVVVEPVGLDEIDFDQPLGRIVPPPVVPAVFEPGESGLVLPIGIYRPQPEFPEVARRMRLPGRVVLRAVVDSGGNVTDIEVIFATDPDLGYSEAAIEAVRQWRYQPGDLRGRTVAVRLTVVVDFDLY